MSQNRSDERKAAYYIGMGLMILGGMVKDALDEADVNFGGKSEKIIMIKCASCGKLNEEDSKFCQECGKQI